MIKLIAVMFLVSLCSANATDSHGTADIGSSGDSYTYNTYNSINVGRHRHYARRPLAVRARRRTRNLVRYYNSFPSTYSTSVGVSVGFYYR